MQGPLGNHKLFNETSLMRQKLEFTGKISKIGIVKLFKAVSNNIILTGLNQRQDTEYLS